MEFSTANNAPVMKTRLLMVWFLLAITLLGCSKQSNSNVSELERNYSLLIPISDTNHSFRIAVDGEKTLFQSGEEIELTVDNESPHALSFAKEPHIRLLASSDQLQWIEVKNEITYSGELQLASRGTILLDTRSTIVKPILEQSTMNAEQEYILLRIVLVGEIIEQEIPTGEKVAAYVDVRLKP